MNLRTVYRNWEEGIRAIVTQLIAYEESNTLALAGKAAIGTFPFYRADGTFDSISIVSGTLPFYDAAGASKPITLVL